MDYPSEELVYLWEGGVPRGYPKSRIRIYAPPMTVPTDDDVAGYEVAQRQRWERYQVPERRQRPWITFRAECANAIEIEERESDGNIIYLLRLPNGRRLRVWPWKIFKTEWKVNAEYMRLKAIAMASGAEPPPNDYGYRTWLDENGKWLTEMRRLKELGQLPSNWR